VRWSYVISENICFDLGIFLKPGCHTPPDWKKDEEERVMKKTIETLVYKSLHENRNY
jgi:hypothetical protein